MDTYIQMAKKIIADNIYMTIAMASTDGLPWISPVFFAFDEHYNLYWVSNKEARHSQLLRDNPKASIVIFNSQAPEGDGDGVYFETKVQELRHPEEVKQGTEILNKRITKEEFRIKKLGEVTDYGLWRIYKAVPYKISKLTEGEFVNGQYIDKRVEVHL